MGDGQGDGIDPDPARTRFDDIAWHVMEARELAHKADDEFLVHLLNMVLYELLDRGAAASGA